MYKRLVILAVAVVVALTAAVPASAATWIQLRINPSSANWTGSTFADIPMSWTTTMWGGTLLWTPPGRPWGFRASFDTGSQVSLMPSGGFDYSDSSGTWTVWDLSLAYTFMSAAGAWTAFAGWGGSTLTFSGPSYGYSRQIASGLVLGVDFRRPLSGNWYIAGSATLGPGQRYTYEIGAPGTFLGTPGTATTSIYSVGIGQAFSGGSASWELGWRSGGFTGNGTGSSADGANIRWSGVYLGVNFIR